VTLPTPPRTAAAALRLPRAEHLARVPAGVDPPQLERVRQAAHLLPQVMRPADLAGAGGPPDEAHAAAEFDRRGCILLHKAVPGARSSRWISPADIAPALAHLAVVGSGPGARPLMLERLARVQALGVDRQDGLWWRGAQAQVAIGSAAWTLTVAHRWQVDATHVWDFLRQGDEKGLVDQLGPPADLAGRELLQAHVDQLFERSRALSSQHLDGLLPRLQSECLRAQPLPELLAACSRAQERWERQVGRDLTLAGLNQDLAFQGYPDSFAAARRASRRITLFLGPPNSGKTHAAFDRLEQALSGAYLAPLRLLALEGRDRLLGRGVPCSLLTGEENVPADGARVVSSTIEMVDTRRELDVAVIDEAQMLFDPSRGWAWTQAIVGVPAREVIVIASAHAATAIERLLGLCGESCDRRVFERKQPVRALSRPVRLAQLEPGDAVVAFSRREVLGLRDRIAAQGHEVSVVYGALPPEVRRREAERFAQGRSHILVATDAIGMGLNLPIRRVLFSTMEKFDGVGDRPLDESEVSQIAGRAGRFGMQEEGFVGVLDEAEPDARRHLAELLLRTPQAPRDFKAPVAPSLRHVETIAARLGLHRLREVLEVFVAQLRLDDRHFEVAELAVMLELASQLDDAATALSLRDRFVYAQAPVDGRSDAAVRSFLDWAHDHARRGRVGRPGFLDEVDGHSRLDHQEEALRAITLWLWLDLRFPGCYGLQQEVTALRWQLAQGIERHLQAERPLARPRRSGQRGRQPRGARR
jgi:ATP-dependent RNA helicase SUPV3L1/SUV3